MTLKALVFSICGASALALVLFIGFDYYKDLLQLKQPFPKERYERETSKNASLDYQNVRECNLTLFTTMPVTSRKSLMYMDTIHNWKQLHKWNVTTILFSKESDKAEQARSVGWRVFPVPATSKSNELPLLPQMFLESFKIQKSCLYGFVNADIIFEETFVQSIEAVLSDRELKEQSMKKPMLIVSRRRNMYGIDSDISRNWTRLSKVARKHSKLFTSMSEDVFFTSPNYPWQDYPPIAVGLLAYDNWLLLRANELGHVTVDISQTLLAVHQNRPSDNKERTHTDNSYNLDLLKKLFGAINYEKGRATCAEYETKEGYNGLFFIRRRHPKNLASCHL